jgi:hypothetical protein
MNINYGTPMMGQGGKAVYFNRFTEKEENKQEMDQARELVHQSIGCNCCC